MNNNTNTTSEDIIAQAEEICKEVNARVATENTKKKNGYKAATIFLGVLTILLCGAGYFVCDVAVDTLKTADSEIHNLAAKAAAAEARIAELEKPKSFSEKLKGLVQN